MIWRFSKANPVTVPRSGFTGLDVFDEFRRETVGLREEELSACLPGNGSLVGVAKPSSGFDQRLQH
jgi:hypothetical protein